MTAAIAFPRIGEAAEGAVSCKLHAFAIDPDPKGTNIRAAPRADAPVIGHLPPRWHLAKDIMVGADFEVTASQDGWLKIQGAAAGAQGEDEKRVFDGPGWIWGGLVGVTLGEPVLRSAARRDAPIVAQLYRPDGWGPDSYQVSRVRACEGEFVEVTAKPPRGAAVQGWSYRPCANELTTCDWGGNEPPLPSAPELWRDEANTKCLALPDEQNRACTVEQFGRLGTVYVTTLYYATYHYAAPQDRGIGCRRAVILEDTGGGHLHQLFATPGDPAVQYDEPRIIKFADRTLLQIPGHESGTGNLNREQLFVWRDYNWGKADTTSWVDDLGHRLPAGLAVSKGVYPDYTTMVAETPLWRKSDSNACPTGGRARINLGWRDDRVVLRSVRVERAGECGEPIP